MNTNIYIRLYLSYVWKRVQDEIADEKTFAKKHKHLSWFPDSHIPDIFLKIKKINHQSVMGFSNHAQTFTIPYYLIADPV